MADIGVQLGLGSVLPLPRNDVGQRVRDWIAGVIEATRARLDTPVRRSEPKERQHYPGREMFIEDAAMSREMFRL